MRILSQILTVYSEIDQQVAAFQLATGLRCPNSCGSCCTADDIHTSPLEMLPMAHEILLRGESQLWLDRIHGLSHGSRCVFYNQAKLVETPGHCTHYAWRPAICRLFGFGAVRRRDGSLELAACKLLKQTQPEDIMRAKTIQSQAPCFSHFGLLLNTIDLSASELMPINRAFERAILRLGLQMQMTHSEELGTTSAA